MTPFNPPQQSSPSPLWAPPVPDPVSHSHGRAPWAIVFGGQLLLGLIAGLIWLAWAPKTVGYLIPGANNATLFIPDESENQIAGDGRYCLLTVIVGAAAALLAWYLLRHRRGPLTLTALALSSLLSSLLARWIGEVLSSGHNTGALRTAIQPTLTLHALPLLLVQSFVAVLVYTALAGFNSDPGFTGVRTEVNAGEPAFVAQAPTSP
ncbi:MAG: hypothetical protein QOK10_694 [Pseudonocardiales bacterium]|nr:hypothetical protein [Pseudonocardiales bacterium]